MARAKIRNLQMNNLGSAGGVSAGAGAGATVMMGKKLQKELVKSARDKISKMTPSERERAKEQIEKAKSDRKTKKVNDEIDSVTKKTPAKKRRKLKRLKKTQEAQQKKKINKKYGHDKEKLKAAQKEYSKNKKDFNKTSKEYKKLGKKLRKIKDPKERKRLVNKHYPEAK